MLFSAMALTRNLTAHGLRRGDVVRLVEHHIGPDDSHADSMEVFNAVGDTVTVTAVDEADLPPLHTDQVCSVRRLNSPAA